MSRLSKGQVITATIIVVVIIILGALGVLGLLRAPAQSASAPTLGFFYQLGTSIRQGWLRLGGSDEMSQEILRLRAQVAELERAQAELSTLKQENEELRQIADYQSVLTNKVLTASLVGERLVGSRDYILVDRGSVDGIRAGNLVLDNEGRLLGDLIEVSSQTSLLRLLVAPDFSAAVRLPGGASVGKASGDLSLGLKLEFVPLEAALALGDIIVTADKPFAVLGEVDFLETVTGELFQSGTIRPFADTEARGFVTIILDEDKSRRTP